MKITHIYGISFDSDKLLHFDEKFNLIENVPKYISHFEII